MLKRSRRSAKLRYRPREEVVRDCLDCERGLVAEIDRPHVILADVAVDLHGGEIFRDDEQQRLFARDDRLTHFHIARDHCSVNR